MREIRLQGFGPIGEGTINLSPLTILIGQNGCGKSYTGMALHSLFASDASDRVFQAHNQVKETFDEEWIEGLKEMSDQLYDESNNTRVVVPPDKINSIVETYLRHSLTESFENALTDTFATQLRDLITVGRDKIVIEISTDFGPIKLGYYEGWGEFRVERHPTFENPIELQLVSVEGIDEYTPITEAEDYITLNIIDREFRLHQDTVEILIEGLSVCFEELFLPKPFNDSYYLPAPRAGFLESHEILSAGAFNTLSRAGIEPIEVPAFSGAVSNYLSQIANISQTDDLTELADLAKDFEEDVLGGKIKIEPSEQEPQPNITFSQYGQEFPFYLTSTGISEIAPLTLFTKYKLTSGETVIIEEPEAHLHPENQRKVAEYITNLVNEEVRVVVTTHSDFFIEQLSNLVRLSGVGKQKRKEAGLGDLPPLKPQDISINMFYSEEGPEFSSESLDINKIDGVPMDQFEEVGDELYGQAHKVDSLLQEEYN